MERKIEKQVNEETEFQIGDKKSFVENYFPLCRKAKRPRRNCAYGGINIKEHVVKHRVQDRKEIKYECCQECDEPCEDSPVGRPNLLWHA